MIGYAVQHEGYVGGRVFISFTYKHAYVLYMSICIYVDSHMACIQINTKCCSLQYNLLLILLYYTTRACMCKANFILGVCKYHSCNNRLNANVIKWGPLGKLYKLTYIFFNFHFINLNCTRNIEPIFI